MAESLGTQFLRADLEVNCPKCGYPFWVTGAEVVAQVACTCPCCRVRVWLRDADGSFHNASRNIEQQIEGTLREIWR